MRILFAYFDFTVRQDPNSARLLGECALNFSTTYNYSVQKIGIGAEADYIVSRCEKPENEKLPAGFWGDRIYNVTAIVGNNGAGKSTILHSMIKAVVCGLKPAVPFLLVLQLTESEELYLYGSYEHFVWKGQERFLIQNEYPESLMETKSMLLDNTLSVSSIELDSWYRKAKSANFTQNSNSDKATSSQFYNKSLIASIRYSNAVSMSNYVPVIDAISTHFRYETYQETRFLFDRYQRRNLDDLEKAGYPIHPPKELFVTVNSTDSLLHLFSTRRKTNRQSSNSLPVSFDRLQKMGFIGAVMTNALLNLCFLMADQYKLDIFDVFYDNKSEKGADSAIQNKAAESYPAIKIATEILQVIRSRAATNQLIKHVNQCDAFLHFLSDNEETVRDIFEPFSAMPLPSEGKIYRIDMQAVFSDDEKLKCMISFLNKYRPVREPFYFMIFSCGMSSGEKNLLRMLTQFWFMFDRSEDDSEADRTETCLRNSFSRHNQRNCDTLFLFLDEADLTYHPEWQRIFIFILTFILPRMFRDPYNKEGESSLKYEGRPGCKDIQVFLATHSPLMLGDFPKASINYLQWGVQSTFTTNSIPQHSSFGENLYTILRNGFFMKYTVSEFAREKINAAAKWCADIRASHIQSKEEDPAATGNKTERSEDLNQQEIQKVFDGHYITAQMLPPGIIKNKLRAELEECGKMACLAVPGETENELTRMKNRIDEIEKANEQLRKERDQAYEKLRKAGLK